ncbi:MAG: zinc-regulated TonB-dependent outer membrane receptor [Deltaproteobacteria bacterium]|nr:zinc-regulated TonB-dependent outer membrane receptor [Deltaproteobacteria bacterium]
MPCRLHGAPLLGVLILQALGAGVARAEEPPSAPPSQPLDEDETKKLLEELEAAERADPLPSRTNQPPGVPDLSRVNLLAGAPGIASLNPDIAVIADVAAAAFGVAQASVAAAPEEDAPLMTGGHDPTHSGFTLRQLELALGASVDPFFRFDAALVFLEGVEVEEAFATTLALPLSLQARAGMFLSRFGRHNEQHPHAWSFVAQPLVYGQLMGGDDHRGLGAELSWLTPLPWATTLYASAQETAGACCSRTFSPEADTPAALRTPLDLVATGVVEQFFPLGDDLGLLWGLSAQLGPAQYLGPDGRAELWGTDVLLRYKPTGTTTRWFVELQAEAMLRTRRTGRAALFEPSLVDGGAYAQLIYHPGPELGAGLRVDWLDGEIDDVAGAGLGRNSGRLGVVLEYAPTHFSRLLAEVNAGTRGQGVLLWGAIVNLEVSIGAHGAHAY